MAAVNTLNRARQTIKACSEANTPRMKCRNTRKIKYSEGWGSNPRPRDYESPALTAELPSGFGWPPVMGGYPNPIPLFVSAPAF